MTHPRMVADDDPLLARLRAVCLALPGATEKVSHGRPVFACTKVFAVYGGGVKVRPGVHEPHDQALLFKAEPVEVPALDEDGRFFVPAYYGPAGWRGVDLDRPDLDRPDLDRPDLDRPEVDWAEVAELVDASYRLVAPRRRVAELDARLEAPGAARE